MFLLLVGAVLVEYDLPKARARFGVREAILNASQMLGCGVELSAREKALEKSLRIQRNELLLTPDFPYGSPSAFYGAKERVEKSGLFGALHRMPKGAALHLHLELAGNYTWLAEVLVDKYWENLYVNNNGSLNFRSGIPAKTMYPNATARWLFDKITYTSHDDSWQSPRAWDQFDKSFGFIADLFDYLPMLEAWLANTLRMFSAAGYGSLELKYKYGGKYDDDGPVPVSREVEMYRELQNNILPFTVIAEIGRSQNQEKALEDAGSQLEFADVLDLVDEEDKGHSYRYHRPTLEFAKSRGKVLVVHAGETSYAGATNRARPAPDPEDLDIYDTSLNVVEAVAAGAHRIGHGISAGHSHVVLQALAGSGTCVAVNPLSNLLLRFVPDLRSHSARQLCAHRVPFVISNDDNALFDTNPPTHDVVAAVVSWGLDLAQLKAILLASVSEVCATTKIRQSDFEEAWDRWVETEPLVSSDDPRVWSRGDELEWQRWADAKGYDCENGVLVLPQGECRCFEGFDGRNCSRSPKIPPSLLPLATFLLGAVSSALLLLTTTNVRRRHNPSTSPTDDTTIKKPTKAAMINSPTDTDGLLLRFP
ncbi:hypothetical protein CTAYLR_001304 [Chrysophaeum taylorii]|uniref:Adenosine deaminase domain-containing protein n=1 Tax=Chrysophaeum taylorii TaxID=2483200 RepID=A0AAD7XLA5_9STRA|nr:hypothetical protein CTAYLR_001304 [Chrysophaeum taylorii]